MRSFCVVLLFLVAFWISLFRHLHILVDFFAPSVNLSIIKRIYWACTAHGAYNGDWRLYTHYRSIKDQSPSSLNSVCRRGLPAWKCRKMQNRFILWIKEVEFRFEVYSFVNEFRRCYFLSSYAYCIHIQAFSFSFHLHLHLNIICGLWRCLFANSFLVFWLNYIRFSFLPRRLCSFAVRINQVIIYVFGISNQLKTNKHCHSSGLG